MNILLKNDFPTSLINRIYNRHAHINQTERSHSNNFVNETSQQTTTVQYRSIKYIKGLSEQSSKLIKKHNNNLQIAFSKTGKKLSCYSGLKDPISKWDTNNIVYQIDCKDCDKVYIGMSKNQLKTRVSQHKSNVNKLTQATNFTDKLTASNKTALTQHAYNLKHSFDFENSKILNTQKNYNKLMFMEMLQIQGNNRTVNIRTDTNNLSNTYKTIIHRLNSNHKRVHLKNTTNSNITDFPT
jgi:hypothetical protein